MFLGAFLLFLVQPLVGKFLLPSFGGGPAVWTTCMLFFQAALLVGYAYAHLGVSRLAPRAQAIVHGVLLLAAVAATWAALPAALAATFRPSFGAGAGKVAPILQILGLLALGVGVPAVALAATSPLLNAWYGRVHAASAAAGAGAGAGPEGSKIYRLYAVSNLGSLLGLLGYPFVVEPLVSRRMQAVLWASGLAAFALLCGYCAWRASRVAATHPAAGHDLSSEADDRPGFFRKLAWLVLPACATVLLLATTNTMTQDIASVPFLWVLPLALYLLTFIAAFAGKGQAYRPAVMLPGVAVAAAAVCWVLFQDYGESIVARTGVLAGSLFLFCMVCHGELAALRPPPRHLTAYYLTIAAGGALGGVLVGVVAPLVLTRNLELNVGVWVCCVLALVVPWARRSAERRAAARAARAAAEAASPTDRVMPEYQAPAARNVAGAWAAAVSVIRLLAVAGLVVLGFLLWAGGTRFLTDAVLVHRSRDFFGVVTVYDEDPDSPQIAARSLFHGSILHGQQFLAPDKRRLPTTYYGPESGINFAMTRLARPGARRVGVVGLGAGVLAAFGREGDEFRYYEISPLVAAIARERFTFLADSPARHEIVLGDARVSIEREPESRKFDVLILDAFSGDAIPVHLLTAEAFALYRRHLAPGALVCVQISNRHVNLEPVLQRHAADAGWQAVIVSGVGGDSRQRTVASDWILMATHPEGFARLETGVTVRGRRLLENPNIPRWTDEYASLLRVLK